MPDSRRNLMQRNPPCTNDAVIAAFLDCPARAENNRLFRIKGAPLCVVCHQELASVFFVLSTALGYQLGYCATHTTEELYEAWKAWETERLDAVRGVWRDDR